MLPEIPTTAQTASWVTFYHSCLFSYLPFKTVWLRKWWTATTKGCTPQAAHLSPLLLSSQPMLPIENRDTALVGNSSPYTELASSQQGQSQQRWTRSGLCFTLLFHRWRKTRRRQVTTLRSLSEGWPTSGKRQTQPFLLRARGFWAYLSRLNLARFLSLRKSDMISEMLEWNFTRLLLLG